MKKLLLLTTCILLFILSCNSSEIKEKSPKQITLEDRNIVKERKSAWESGIHPNAFVEHKIATEAQVKEKVQQTYKQLFYSDDGMLQEGGKALLVSVGTDMAFINSVDSKDIRSEGMSYGMIIAVMMDDQNMFNKLWKFSKTKMQHQKGERKGYFAWSLKKYSSLRN